MDIGKKKMIIFKAFEYSNIKEDMFEPLHLNNSWSSV